MLVVERAIMELCLCALKLKPWIWRRATSPTHGKSYIGLRHIMMNETFPLEIGARLQQQQLPE